MKLARSVNKAIRSDEVGIQYGRYGPFVLKTLYQPIFRRRPEGLKPCGVEGLIKPFVGGTPVPALSFLGQVPRGDRFFIEVMCRALHLRNYANLGVEGLLLFFNFDPRAHDDVDRAIRQIRYMAGRIEEIQLPAHLLVCEITETEAVDPEILRRLAAEMRMHGVRLAIDDFGIGHSTLERVAVIEPDIVKLDGPWFRRIAAAPSAIGLLNALVAGLQQRGAEVLIEGIQTPGELKVALDAGADLLQGYLLARPALAGTMFDTEPLDPGALLSEPDNVVRLVHAQERNKDVG